MRGPKKTAGTGTACAWKHRLFICYCLFFRVRWNSHDKEYYHLKWCFYHHGYYCPFLGSSFGQAKEEQIGKRTKNSRLHVIYVCTFFWLDPKEPKDQDFMAFSCFFTGRLCRATQAAPTRRPALASVSLARPSPKILPLKTTKIPWCRSQWWHLCSRGVINPVWTEVSASDNDPTLNAVIMDYGTSLSMRQQVWEF